MKGWDSGGARRAGSASSSQRVSSPIAQGCAGHRPPDCPTPSAGEPAGPGRPGVRVGIGASGLPLKSSALKPVPAGACPTAAMGNTMPGQTRAAQPPSLREGASGPRMSRRQQLWTQHGAGPASVEPTVISMSDSNKTSASHRPAQRPWVHQEVARTHSRGLTL